MVPTKTSCAIHLYGIARQYFCTSAVGIAVYRYLLVCQAVCVHNLGEGRVWRVVSTSVLLLSLLSGALSVHSWADSYMFLLCSGREEHFRSDDYTFPLLSFTRRLSHFFIWLGLKT